jgi:hypothetical protein
LTSTAANDGTLKAAVPVAVSPVNDQRLVDSPPTLVANASALKFGTERPLYQFHLFDPQGALVEDSGLIGGSAYRVTSSLDFDTRYTWQVRAGVAEGPSFGPWSTPASFLTQEGGYIRGNELYDPLHNGRTVGQIHGPVTFIPGVGVRLETFESYISYELPQTLTEGEFSILATNIPSNTDGDKTKLFAMSQGYSDIVTNDRRMTVEKRGDPAGIVAWRLITHDDQVDTEGAERQFVNFLAHETYFWQATWRNNFFNLLIREGGESGPTIYDKGKPFHGRPYDPVPHVIYIGAPVGRSGPNGASVEGAIIRQVWVSARPRPASANR